MTALIELGALIFGIYGLFGLCSGHRTIRVRLTRRSLPSGPVLIGVVVVVIALAAYGT